MRAIAFAIVLAAIFLWPNEEVERATAGTKRIMSIIMLFAFMGFIICVLGGF
jgi:hypothetical protein